MHECRRQIYVFAPLLMTGTNLIRAAAPLQVLCVCVCVRSEHIILWFN